MDGLGSYARFELLYLRASKQNSVMKRSIHRHVLQFYVRSMTFLDLYLEQTIHCTYLLSKYYLKLCYNTHLAFFSVMITVSFVEITIIWLTVVLRGKY